MLVLCSVYCGGGSGVWFEVVVVLLHVDVVVMEGGGWRLLLLKY